MDTNPNTPNDKNIPSSWENNYNPRHSGRIGNRFTNLSRQGFNNPDVPPLDDDNRPAPDVDLNDDDSSVNNARKRFE